MTFRKRLSLPIAGSPLRCVVVDVHGQIGEYECPTMYVIVDEKRRDAKPFFSLEEALGWVADSPTFDDGTTLRSMASSNAMIEAMSTCLFGGVTV